MEKISVNFIFSFKKLSTAISLAALKNEVAIKPLSNADLAILIDGKISSFN